jgi:hypothetical protein
MHESGRGALPSRSRSLSGLLRTLRVAPRLLPPPRLMLPDIGRIESCSAAVFWRIGAPFDSERFRPTPRTCGASAAASVCGKLALVLAGSDVRRRKFITLLGSSAAWPLGARAQQPAMPIIGLVRDTPSAPFPHIVNALRHGLGEIGFIDGQNVRLEQRWAEGHDDRLPALVADLIRQRPAVIVANRPAALAAKAGGTTIPVVFATGNDPSRTGWSRA